MKIWIICTGEPVPFLPDEAGDRFLRAGCTLSAPIMQSAMIELSYSPEFGH